ncbi:MAG: hypothetical protein ACLR2O_05715, partial [Coprococcus sp.]
MKEEFIFQRDVTGLLQRNDVRVSAYIFQDLNRIAAVSGGQRKGNIRSPVRDQISITILIGTGDLQFYFFTGTTVTDHHISQVLFSQRQKVVLTLAIR